MKTKFFRLNKEKIEEQIKKGSLGVYLIGAFREEGFFVRYVGRSKNLRRRLLNHAGRYKNHYFAFIILNNECEAYKKEYELYCAYEGINNKIAPARAGPELSRLHFCECEINSLLIRRRNSNGS